MEKSHLKLPLLSLPHLASQLHWVCNMNTGGKEEIQSKHNRVVCCLWWFFFAFEQGCCGISPFSCCPPSLGIMLEFHARAEGMGSCRGKRGKEHCRREESKEKKIQPWLVEHWVSSLVGDGFGCVVFLQQVDNISSEYSRAELGETTRFCRSSWL